MNAFKLFAVALLCESEKAEQFERVQIVCPRTVMRELKVNYGENNFDFGVATCDPKGRNYFDFGTARSNPTAILCQRAIHTRPLHC